MDLEQAWSPVFCFVSSVWQNCNSLPSPSNTLFFFSFSPTSWVTMLNNWPFFLVFFFKINQDHLFFIPSRWDKTPSYQTRGNYLFIYFANLIIMRGGQEGKHQPPPPSPSQVSKDNLMREQVFSCCEHVACCFCRSRPRVHFFFHARGFEGYWKYHKEALFIALYQGLGCFLFFSFFFVAVNIAFPSFLILV